MVDSVRLGEWVVNTSDKAGNVENSPAIEAFLARYLASAMPLYTADYPVQNLSMARFGIPAPVIRMDMPPATEGFRGVYEVEANPSGLGIADMINLPMAGQIAGFLRAQGISEIGYAAAPSRLDQMADHDVFMKALGRNGVASRLINLESERPRDMPLWLRAGQEDIKLLLSGENPLMSDCLLCHYDGGGHKGYLIDIGDAVSVETITDFSEEPFDRYPDGFVLKPKHGWGTRDTHVYVPRTPFKKSGVTRAKMVRLLNDVRELRADEKYILQPFGAPEVSEDGAFRIWRLYALWDGTAYRVVGGFWAQRKSSLRIHGADDCVMGPLVVKH